MTLKEQISKFLEENDPDQFRPELYDDMADRIIAMVKDDGYFKSEHEESGKYSAHLNQ